jgi:predicted nucleic acid-binding protein
MGAKGSEARFREGLVLDAGALIAFERAEKRIAAFVEEAMELGEEITIPATVLAQAWRGGPRAARLSRLIGGSQSDSLNELRAKEVGERLGNRDAADIADAHVVCCALERNAALITTDPDDMNALAEPDEDLTVVSV